MKTKTSEKMVCESCRYYTEGTIYPDGNTEHLCSCPASPFLDDSVDPDGSCSEYKEVGHGQD